MKKMITTRTFSFWMSLTTLVLIAGADFKARAAAPASVPTFHCISLYWTPASVDTTREVLVKYRITGTQQWYEALPLVYNQVTTSPLQKALYRGSIVNLTPGTSYEITLKEAGTGTGVEEVTLSETTLSENFPGSTVFTLTATRTTPLSITASGTAAAYQIYDGNGQTIDLGNTGAVGITVDADYVVIRNFTIKNTTRHGIQLLGQHHHIVIENCDISKWGSRDNGSWTYDNGTPNDPSDDKSGPNQTSETDFGMNDQSAIYAYNTWDGPAASNLVIQRNKLHHPNHDTNNWSELHGTPYNGDNGKHPNGPGVVYLQNSGGNNIIRFNEIYSDATHFFNDGIGGRVNTSLRGYPGTDSDIYGNYISFCHDDAFEIEGGGQNIRIWNNFVENTLQGIANACVRIGPIYVWRNVYGKGTTVAGGGVRSLYSIKMGWSGGIENITGYQYYFNNTYLQPNDEGYGGIGTMGSLTSNRVIRHVTTRNNILQARSTAQQAISQDSRNRNNDFDYDLISTPESGFPAGHETHGISGLPGYITGWGFSGTPGTTALTGIFRIGNDTPGKDAAQIVPNFSDVYTGAGPDVGAHEGKSADMQFGVAATFTPNHLAAQPITFTSASTKTYGGCTFYIGGNFPFGPAGYVFTGIRPGHFIGSHADNNGCGHHRGEGPRTGQRGVRGQRTGADNSRKQGLPDHHLCRRSDKNLRRCPVQSGCHGQLGTSRCVFGGFGSCHCIRCNAYHNRSRNCGGQRKPGRGRQLFGCRSGGAKHYGKQSSTNHRVQCGK